MYPDSNTYEDPELGFTARPSRRTQPLPGFRTILEQNLALTPRPTIKVHYDPSPLFRTFGPSPALVTCPTTHEWYVIISKRRYWYVLQPVDLRGGKTYTRHGLKFIHFIEFRYFLPGLWAVPPMQ